MPVYTVVTDYREASHVSQHAASSPEQALALHVGSMPHDDGDEGEGEIDWLSRIAHGEEPAALLAVGGCANVWLWSDGASRVPPYRTYIVQTEVA